MSTETMKPCPFCGEAASPGIAYFVECLGCGMRTGEYWESVGASSVWNRRATAPAAISALTDGSIWAMFEEHFAKAFPGAECAHFDVSLITKDGELAKIGVTREGFVERLEEFEEDPR